jgi:inorganic phosphate transporter, PiT family
MSIIWLYLAIGLAFFLAWNLGANDVANAMGTSVGSKVVTLRQAIVLAGILELAGAVCFGREVTATLAGKVASIQRFEGQPQLYAISIVAELLATGLWLLFATWQGWPVASSHAAVAAIATINLLAFGLDSLNGSMIRTIALSWLLTPVASGLMSATFFAVLQRGLLQQSAPEDRWHHWSPWLSVAVVSLVGGLVLPTALDPFATFAQHHWHWTLPPHDYALGVGAFGVLGLTLWTTHPLKAALVHQRDPLEGQLGKFQLVSACCMAFAHGSNDVGNAVAPLAGFVQLWQTQTLPVADVAAPLWILVLGGIGIVTGLSTWGKRVIATVGEKLTTLKPSYGFCAELGAATTVLLASHWGLPISTTHALVGSVVGVGLMQAQGAASLQWATVRQIAAAWFVTVPACMTLAGIVFTGLRSLMH